MSKGRKIVLLSLEVPYYISENRADLEEINQQTERNINLFQLISEVLLQDYGYGASNTPCKPNNLEIPKALNDSIGSQLELLTQQRQLEATTHATPTQYPFPRPQ